MEVRKNRGNGQTQVVIIGIFPLKKARLKTKTRTTPDPNKVYKENKIHTKKIPENKHGIE
jgi:hypothetical protein